MKKSKMLYITKKLSKEIDLNNDQAIKMIEHSVERLERYSSDSDKAKTYRENKAFWLGYSQALDNCQDKLLKLIADIEESEEDKNG